MKTRVLFITVLIASVCLVSNVFADNSLLGSEVRVDNLQTSHTPAIIPDYDWGAHTWNGMLNHSVAVFDWDGFAEDGSKQ